MAFRPFLVLDVPRIFAVGIVELHLIGKSDPLDRLPAIDPE